MSVMVVEDRGDRAVCLPLDGGWALCPTCGRAVVIPDAGLSWRFTDCALETGLHRLVAS